ncbi:UDP-N-acetylmuramoyl-L-alanine--D-glutamate ligase [Marinospirillum insulare]|uniref:UDP-N-acetylmuramoylalanine--D-glutamate ligase n=1 Tax=Marinospirillum insulare TaxID=217169 RepID=A0ABQ5ZUL8_9GAMM|nr:UDP-N-acetylmuramoyl-L-alanine--D-glutamate ligase [Marinospirillum insulare]GLR63146.1 UDP-N-acetylmuramoylalanine--D-glutamate ligase [Marinospirillum insulare]
MNSAYQNKDDYLIIGLGKTGLSIARFLTAKGKPFSIADTRVNPPGLEAFRQDWPDVSIWLGPLDVELTSSVSCLVVSPGISIADPAIEAAQKLGVKVLGDIELFCREVDQPILAITGSNAKSTVTSLVGEMATEAGLQVGIGGNIGVPVLDLLTQAKQNLYVLELSSFQLETTQSLNALGAALLNISEDHLDRYTGLDDYIFAKQRIYHRCSTAIYNRQDSNTLPIHGLTAARLSFGLNTPSQENELGLGLVDKQRWLMKGEMPLMPASEVSLVGEHGLANTLAAFALGFAAKLPLAAMRSAAAKFKALPHRCELVALRKGIAFYNDSKATNVGAMLAAVKGLATPEAPTWLILGGEGKGQDFSPLKSALAKNIAGVALIGRDAAIIAEHLPKNLLQKNFVSLPQAVAWLVSQAKSGEQILMSPACASFDQFKSFEERGEVFAQCVFDLPS